MLHADVLRAENDSNHVEPKGVTRTLEARHPNHCRPAQFALLAPVHRAHGTAEVRRSTGLNFDEGDGPLRPTRRNACRYEIDVTMTVLESTLCDLPAVNAEPFLGDALSPYSHRLAFC